MSFTLTHPLVCLKAFISSSICHDSTWSNTPSCLHALIIEIERICHHTQRIKEESDIGGIENHYVVLIDNVDKDMSPSTITEFIHRQTSISVRVFVLPSSTAETFTKGAIVLDSKKNLQKLCEFLDSPNHIIVSRRGRYRI